MAQHDMILDNVDGATFLADVNAALQALVTWNAGTTEPATTYPGMLWVDTSIASNGALKMRNQNDSAWVPLQLADPPAVVTGVSTGTVLTTGNAVSNVQDNNLTTFPVGTVLLVKQASGLNSRRLPVTVRLASGILDYEMNQGTGAALAGTWRVSGGIVIPGPAYFDFMERTA